MAHFHAHIPWRFVTAIAMWAFAAGNLAGNAGAQRRLAHAPGRHRVCVAYGHRTRRPGCVKRTGGRPRASRPRPTANDTASALQLHARTAPAAAAPVGPCSGADLVPTATNVAQVEAATLCLIDDVRVENGEPPLIDNGKLHAAARQHSEDMIGHDYFGHTTPQGVTVDARILATGYASPGSSYELGENIDCAGVTLATPTATVTGWMSSPDHRTNILDGDFRDSGIGVAPAAPAMCAEGLPGATYTQDFGVVSSY
jgi:uncharacterized protein YkwD